MKEFVVDFEKAVWLALERVFDLDTKILFAGFIGPSVYFAIYNY